MANGIDDLLSLNGICIRNILKLTETLSQLKGNEIDSLFFKVAQNFEELLDAGIHNLDTVALQNSLIPQIHLLIDCYFKIRKNSALKLAKNWDKFFFRNLILSQSFNKLSFERQAEFFIAAANTYIATNDYTEALPYAARASSLHTDFSVVQSLLEEICHGLAVQSVEHLLLDPIHITEPATIEELFAIPTKDKVLIEKFINTGYSHLVIAFYTELYTKIESNLHQYLLNQSEDVQLQIKQLHSDEIENFVIRQTSHITLFAEQCSNHQQHLIAAKCYEYLLKFYREINGIKNLLTLWSQARAENELKTLQYPIITQDYKHQVETNNLISVWRKANQQLTESRQKLVAVLTDKQHNSKQSTLLNDNNAKTESPSISPTDALANYSITIKTITPELLTHIIRFLGEPPCTLSVAAFGSLVSGEQGPYSDIDIFLLIADTRYRTHSYFRELIRLLDLFLKSLDRSCLLTQPDTPWLWTGLHIDEGDIDPTRDNWHEVADEYIQTPEELAKWIANTAQHESKKIIHGLYATEELYTNDATVNLFQQYETLLSQRMVASLETINDNNNVSSENYRKWILTSWQHMSPKAYGWRQEQGQIFNIKIGYLKPLSNIAWYLGLLWIDFATLHRKKLLHSSKALMSFLVKQNYISESFGTAWQQAWEEGLYWRAFYQAKRQGQPDEINLPIEIPCWPNGSAGEGQFKQSKNDTHGKVPNAEIEMVRSLHLHLVLVVESAWRCEDIDLTKIPKAPLDFNIHYQQLCDKKLKECIKSIKAINLKRNSSQKSDALSLEIKFLISRKVNALFYSQASLEEWVTNYVNLPENVRPFFRNQLEALHILYPEKQSLIKLKNYLATLPTVHGTQPAFRQQQEKWLQTINAFLCRDDNNLSESPFTSHSSKYQVRMRCTNLVYVPGETETASRFVFQTGNEEFLNDDIVKQLFDEKGFPKTPPIEEKEAGRRLALPIRDKKGNIIAFAKFYPALPPIQLTVDAITRRISGYNLSTTLARIKHPKQKMAYPILFSKYAGTTVRKLLNEEKQSDQILEARLDPTITTLQIFETLGIHFGDEKEDNLTEADAVTLNDDRNKILLSIDSDCAFMPSLIKGDNDSSIKLQVASRRLCQPIAKQAMDRLAIYRFAAVELDASFDSVLEEMQSYERAVSEGPDPLFKAEEIQFFLRELEENQIIRGITNFISNKIQEEFCSLRLGYIPGSITQTYLRLKRMQRYLYSDGYELKLESIWPKNILAFACTFQPFMISYYEAAWQTPAQTTEQRYRNLPLEHQLVKDPRTQRQVHQSRWKPHEYSLASVLISQRSDAYQALLNGEVHNAVKELSGLRKICEVDKGIDNALQILQRLPTQNVTMLIEEWRNSTWFEEFIYNFKWAEASSEIQEALFKGLAGTVFTRLNLTHAKINGGQLKKILLDDINNWPFVNKKRNNTFQNLRTLDISYCQQLTDKDLDSGLELQYLPALEKLTTSNLLCTHLNWTNGITTPAFPKLTHLVLRDNQFTELQLDAPNLEHLSLAGCTQLKGLKLNCPQLRFIDLTNCNNLSESTLITALKACETPHKLIGRNPPLMEAFEKFDEKKIKNILDKYHGNCYSRDEHGQSVLTMIAHYNKYLKDENSKAFSAIKLIILEALFQSCQLQIQTNTRLDIKPLIIRSLMNYEEKTSLFIDWLFMHGTWLKLYDTKLYAEMAKAGSYISHTVQDWPPEQYPSINLADMSDEERIVCFALMKHGLAQNKPLGITTFNYSSAELFPDDLDITALWQNAPNLEEINLEFTPVEQWLPKLHKTMWTIPSIELPEKVLDCPNLRRLRLVNSTMITKIVINGPNLSELDLSGCAHIDTYATYSPHLRVCKLLFNELDSEKLSKIMPWLLSLINLENLDLSNNPLIPDSLQLLHSLFDKLTHLESIILDNNNLENDENYHILQKKFDARFLNHSLQAFATQRFTYLEWQNRGLDDDSIHTLHLTLTKYPQPLQAIDLNGNPLTNACLDDLLAIVTQTQSLMVLLIEGTQISKEKLKSILPQLLARLVKYKLQYLAKNNIYEVEWISATNQEIRLLREELAKRPLPLERLDFNTQPSLTDSCVKDLLAIIDQTKTLWAVHLDNTKISQKKQTIISKALQPRLIKHNLQELSLEQFIRLNWRNYGVDDNTIHALGETLSIYPQRLEEIRLDDNPLTDACVTDLLAIIDQTQTLYKISLHGTKISDEKQSIIKKVLSPRFIAYELQVFAYRKIKYLSWSDRGINNQAVHALHEVLTKHPQHIKWISLDYNSLTDACVEDLLAIIQQTKTLRGINLAGTRISEENQNIIKKTLLPHFIKHELQQLTHEEITSLHWPNREIDDQLIHTLRSTLVGNPQPLRFILLNNNPLTDACVEDLLAIIQQARTLREINLAGTRISEENQRIIIKLLAQNHIMYELQKLAKEQSTYLSLNFYDRIFDQTIQALRETLTEHPQPLQKIGLASSSLTDACVEDLLAIIQQTRTLREINLATTRISKENQTLIKKTLLPHFITHELQILAVSEIEYLNWHDRAIDDQTIRTLQQVLADCLQSLKGVELSSNPLTNDCVNDLLAIITKTPRLRQIDLDNTNISAENQNIIRKALLPRFIAHELHELTHEEITSLHWSNREIDDNYIHALHKALTDHSQPLEIIYLDKNPLTDACVEDLLAIIQQTETLQQIDLEGTNINTENRNFIKKALLPHFIARQLQLFTQMKTTHLFWSDHGIDDQAIHTLREKLSKQPQPLERINLCDNPLTDACVDGLLTIIEQTETLYEISLYGTQISQKKQKLITKALGPRAVTHLAEMQTTQLSWKNHEIDDNFIHALRKSLTEDPQYLEEICLDDNPITDACVEALLDIIQQTKTLRKIVLTGTKINEENQNLIKKILLPHFIAHELQELAQNEVKRLYWSDRTIDDQAIHTLRSTLTKHPQPLKSIYLNNNPLTGGCIVDLVAIIQQISTLRKIQLDGTSISIEKDKIDFSSISLTNWHLDLLAGILTTHPEQSAFIDIILPAYANIAEQIFIHFLKQLNQTNLFIQLYFINNKQTGVNQISLSAIYIQFLNKIEQEAFNTLHLGRVLFQPSIVRRCGFWKLPTPIVSKIIQTSLDNPWMSEVQTTQTLTIARNSQSLDPNMKTKDQFIANYFTKNIFNTPIFWPKPHKIIEVDEEGNPISTVPKPNNTPTLSNET